MKKTRNDTDQRSFPAMRPFTIHVPMHRENAMPERMAAFYEEVLDFQADSLLGLWRVPMQQNLAVAFKYADPAECPRGSLFEFFIEKNFPSFCARLRQKGAVFDLIARTPGFYIARIFDPSGNAIEILCEDFADESGVDVSAWSFYQELG